MKKITTILILTLVITSIFIGIYFLNPRPIFVNVGQLDPHDHPIEETPESSSNVFNTIQFWTLRFSNQRGDSYLSLKIQGSIQQFDAGLFYFQFYDQIGPFTSPNVRSALTGSGYTGNLTFMDYETENTFSTSTSGSMLFEANGQTLSYIMNNTYVDNNNIYFTESTDNFGAAMNVWGSTYTKYFADSRVSYTIPPSYMALEYNLRPYLIINSTYYNYDNVRLEVYNFYTSNYYQWQEQDIENVILKYPGYKLRVYDRATDALIFEDTAIQYFTRTREITIDSIKIVNNADEPVNTSFYQTDSQYHYKGFQSWDLELPNQVVATTPYLETRGSPTEYCNYSKPVIIKELASHSKVLMFNASVDAGYNHYYTIYPLIRGSTISTFTAKTGFAIEYWGYFGGLTNWNFQMKFRTDNGTAVMITYGELDGANPKLYLYGYPVVKTATITLNTWHHIRIVCNVNRTVELFLDRTSRIATYFGFDEVENVMVYHNDQYAYPSHTIYLDAFDSNIDPTYYTNRNCELNKSLDLHTWAASTPYNTTSGEYNGIPNDNILISEYSGSGSPAMDRNIPYFMNHKNVIKLIDASVGSTHGVGIWNNGLEGTALMGSFECWYNLISGGTGTPEFMFTDRHDIYNKRYAMINLNPSTGEAIFYNTTTGASHIHIGTFALNQWHHLTMEMNSTHVRVKIDGSTWGILYGRAGNATTVDSAMFIFGGAGLGWTQLGTIYFDAFDILRAPDLKHFYGRNQMINVTASATPYIPTFSKQINPYTETISNLTCATYFYNITDLYGNELEDPGYFNKYSTASITYTPPNTYQNFISLANQRGDYVDWENFRIYVNSTQIYSNLFYYELGSTANVSIYTRFSKYITSSLHTVTRTNNYLPITITQYSLKIYNQQSSFIYSNLTFDPDYYISSQIWSEWVAPNEIIEYFVSAGDYLLNITEYETSTETVYSYSIAGDDLLLVSSSNTISNVLTNIQNVNSTIGNQITNVQIDLTNQNSAINNTIINLEINLNNTNSSLGNLLLNQQTSINNIQNNISTLYVYQQNQFTYMYNNITTSYTNLNSSIFLVNNSIWTGINALEANLISVNNTIAGNLTLILSQNEYLTQIYQYTMFSDFLDWSNATRDANFIANQTDLYHLVNYYRNESVELEFRYANITQSLIVLANDFKEKLFPKTGVDYRVKSISSGTYLQAWTPLNSSINKTVDIGFYEDNFPATPDLEPVWTDILYLIVFLGVSLALVIGLTLYFKGKTMKRKNRRNGLPLSMKAYDESPLYED